MGLILPKGSGHLQRRNGMNIHWASSFSHYLGTVCSHCESSQGRQNRVVAKNGIERSRVLSGVIAWHGHEGGGVTMRDWR